MKSRILSSLRKIFGFVHPLILLGLIVLIILAFAINSSLASLDIQTNELTQYPISESLSQTPSFNNDQDAAKSAQSPLGEDWQTYTDKNLGFSIQYPTSWYDEGTSGSFRGRCFAATEEGLRSEPRFCVALKPFVRLPDQKGASDAIKDQQQFFESLADDKISQVSIHGTRQYVVTRLFQLAGAPALERVETNTPEAEGVEKAYTVAIYINTPQMGLIRLSMHALNKEQFEQNEGILRLILESFSLLE